MTGGMGMPQKSQRRVKGVKKEGSHQKKIDRDWWGKEKKREKE